MSKSGKVWTVLSMLEWATDFFDKKKVPSPRMSIEWILAEVLDVKRLDLYLQFERPLSTEELDKIRPLVKRRAEGEPLQYISGYADFMSCKIEVTPEVLIPRDETEQLVEKLLEEYAHQKTEPLRLLDIGTGSGCIPISIKKEFPAWICEGLDISEKALDVAKKNNRINETDVYFFEADIMNWNEHSRLNDESWDVIISNPPYITDSEKPELEKQVIDYEPALALFHQNPELIYEKIAGFAASKNAALFLEINTRLAAKIEQVVANSFKDVNITLDLDGKERFIIAKNPL